MRSADIQPGVAIGHLTAIAKTMRTLTSGRRMPAWSLRCDCGKIVVAMTANLTKGKHMSCGCRAKDWIADRYPGDGKRPEYSVYRQMLDRCYLQTAPNYRWYGGKGVTVCDRWRNGTEGKTGFQTFIADMGDRPDGLTLDRIDPFAPYGPENCRWATWAEQAVNKRENRLSPSELARLRKERGEKLRGRRPHAKLTDDQVVQIKAALKSGAKTGVLAICFNVAPQTICGIKAGRNWAHVEAA